MGKSGVLDISLSMYIYIYVIFLRSNKVYIKPNNTMPSCNKHAVYEMSVIRILANHNL